jgi:hypothetical protein
VVLFAPIVTSDTPIFISHMFIIINISGSININFRWEDNIKMDLQGGMLGDGLDRAGSG